MREKSVRTDLLLDFYGNLLTPKMRRTCESYYNDDLTLAEIAEAEGISRQGVHDTVKRAEKQLEEYEEKLGLLALFEKQQAKAKNALAHIKSGDSDKAAKEIHRVLKSNGLFCKIFMDWLPHEDEKIMEMEQIVLKYNPHWKGGGFKQYQYSFPEWAENRFDISTIHSYNTVLTFTKEQWLGRIKSCRGVGASLLPERIQAFENEYKNILAKYDEPLKLLHQIHIEIYFAR